MARTHLKIAVFGGSFNPPHIAHVLGATYVLAAAPVDRVLVVPCFRHPFAKSLAPFADRMEMCRLAFACLSNVDVSNVEEVLGGESLTVRTLEHLHAQHPEWSMRLVVGADVVHEMDRWTSPDRVRALAPPLILGRIGHALPPDLETIPQLLPEISSTQIREGLGRDELDEVTEALVPRRVIAYARERRLYAR